MRLSALAVAILSVGLPAVTALSISRNPKSTLLGDGKKVPGESPLELCDGDHSVDILHIESVDISPNPPEPGKEVVVKAVGTVKERINQGAYVLLTVKYGLIRLIATQADLCEQTGNLDLKCPIEPGVLRLTKTFKLPTEIPPGKYTVLADVYNYDDSPITCLTASVQLGHRPTVGFLDL